MCHISLLTANQIEALDALPHKFQAMFERLTNDLTVRDRKGTMIAFEKVMEAAGKGGERVEEAVAEKPVTMPQGIYVRF